jgi:hypothetical protein
MPISLLREAPRDPPGSRPPVRRQKSFDEPPIPPLPTDFSTRPKPPPEVLFVTIDKVSNESGRVAQLVRAPASHAGGRRFESCRAHHPRTCESAIAVSTPKHFLLSFSKTYQNRIKTRSVPKQRIKTKRIPSRWLGGSVWPAPPSSFAVSSGSTF